MKTTILIIIFLASFNFSHSQELLISWSQQNIENYTKEMYDEAQKLSSSELLEKNLKDEYWSEIFLTLNSSINRHSKDTEYLKLLSEQLTNRNETKLKGTSRLIIWDRISSGDIVFEGKGLIIDNDLYTVAGRANQILQSLTEKNFGYVTINSSIAELETLKNKWKSYLGGESVEEYQPLKYENSKLPEVSSLSAIKALIISLQENPKKDQITKKCLKNVYNLDELPQEKGSSASYCNPDTYTYSYLGILFGDEKIDETKTSDWWIDFWNKNKNNLIWNSEKGIYQIKL